MFAYGQSRVMRGDLRLAAAVILVFALTLTTVVTFVAMRDSQSRIFYLESQVQAKGTDMLAQVARKRSRGSAP